MDITPNQTIVNFATICTAIAVTISGYQILMHILHYHEPRIQLQVIRILSIIPVYSISTWLSIMYPSETLTFSTLRDIYEAYVLYIFMQMLVQFLGGENELIVHLEFKRRIKQPWPFDRLTPLQTDKIFYRRVKQGVLQFVMIKPVAAITAIILDRYGVYNEGSFDYHNGYFYCSLVSNTSISLSLYCLILFYMATEERLKPFSPFYKFLTVKSILFFSFWQTCLFQMLYSFQLLERETGNMALNIITCFEMVIIAYAQSQAFNVSQFLLSSPPVKRKECCIVTVFKVLFATSDVIDDARNTFIKDLEEQKEHQLQMDELKQGEKAFNWSDDELIQKKSDKKYAKFNIGKPPIAPKIKRNTQTSYLLSTNQKSDSEEYSEIEINISVAENMKEADLSQGQTSENCFSEQGGNRRGIN